MGLLIRDRIAAFILSDNLKMLMKSVCGDQIHALLNTKVARHIKSISLLLKYRSPLKEGLDGVVPKIANH